MNLNFQHLLSDAARAKVLQAFSSGEHSSAQPGTGALERLSEATRLTQAGDLMAATAAIQAALRGDAAASFPVATAFPQDPATEVIDIEARELTPEPSANPAPGNGDLAQSAPAKPGPSEGHGQAGQFISGSHTEAAGTRAYKLYVPNRRTDEKLPLVVMLHGCTQNPDDFAAGTGMNEAARERGFYVLYPAQTQHANSSRCWNWFKHNHQKRGKGEPALLTGMTREIMRTHPIEPARVYVAGLSAGGAMAAILGDTYPDVFAAVGVHSGLASGSATDVQSAFSAMKTGAVQAPRAAASPPTIVFHGDLDGTVSPINGEQVVAASAAGARAHATHHQRNGRACTQKIYRRDDGHIVAEHWAVHGAGHAWSGGSTAGSYTDARGPDATDEMLRFFFANPLPFRQ